MSSTGTDPTIERPLRAFGPSPPNRPASSLRVFGPWQAVGVPYREIAPPPDLAHVVRCLWERTGAGEPVVVLPDGCLDVVVRDGRAAVAGPDTAPVRTAVPAGARIAGVRFHPGAAAAALGVPAGELRDQRVPLDALWGRSAAGAVVDAGADPLALAAALRPRLRDAAPDLRVLAAARRLARVPATPVPVLAAALGLGERQLRRRFAAAVGYGPKTFARVARLHAALGLLGGSDPLARVAADAGYADQAHMTRELAALAGTTPAALRGTRSSPGRRGR